MILYRDYDRWFPKYTPSDLTLGFAPFSRRTDAYSGELMWQASWRHTSPPEHVDHCSFLVEERNEGWDNENLLLLLLLVVVVVAVA
jgi:hypothetical protein